MKILHINTNDISGGAARAAYRLHQGLLNEGINSMMLVQKKDSDDSTVIGPKTKLDKGWALIKPEIDKLPLKIFNTKQDGPWSVNWLPTNIIKKINQINPDIINLHWIGNGMISIRELGKIKKPVVWTMHDMWPFTGGFHYSQEFFNQDGSWISKNILNQKLKSWKGLNLTLVSPSKWLADLAVKSNLFKSTPTKVIPYGLDTNIFKPVKKEVATDILNLNSNKQYILFGAMNATSDKRKGFQFLLPAIQELSKKIDKSKTELLVFGSSEPESPPKFNIKTNYLGRIYDDAILSLIYSISSVCVVPSLQDNLPNTVLESLSCGTPCIAFNIGGIPDMIDHHKNGYLVKLYDTKDLADGIKYCLDNSEKLGETGRKKVEKKYDLKTLAKNYIKLYSS
jgi:glycosyltransferase involved in cell wall biosynthesis